MTIGENLKRLRLLHGFTQEEVAKAIKVSIQTVYKYEQGIITNIPLDKIQSLAALFEIDPASILGWSRSDSAKELQPSPIADQFKTAYDKLTPEKQLLIDQMIQAMLDKP